MNRHKNHGMTLVELMIVVFIIALLSGIMAFFVTGNRSSTAQVDLNNDIASLFQAQRMRATSMNVATYIQASDTMIEPRIGSNSVCTAADSEQYPIRYDNSNNSPNVGIDIKTGKNGAFRTLDSTNSSKYIKGSNPLTKLQPAFVKTATTSTTETVENVNGLVICFQPNGQTYFMKNSSGTMTFEDDALKARLTICTADNTPEGFYLDVTGLGMISSSMDKSACEKKASD